MRDPQEVVTKMTPCVCVSQIFPKVSTNPLLRPGSCKAGKSSKMSANGLLLRVKCPQRYIDKIPQNQPQIKLLTLNPSLELLLVPTFWTPACQKVIFTETPFSQIQVSRFVS